MQNEENSIEKKFQSWAVIELMGKTVLAGFVEEVTVAGSQFLRISVPKVGDGGGFDKLLHPQSIFAITPSDMSLCRSIIENRKIRPYSIFVHEQSDVTSDASGYPFD